MTDEPDAGPSESLPAGDASSAPSTPHPQCIAPPAFIFDSGILPAPLLAATLQRATICEVIHPGCVPAEPRYTLSRKLARFVRCRDLTCRFPGCDEPATGCDLDTVARLHGPTHASNIKCLCRFH
jgi:hypothetical protein